MAAAAKRARKALGVRNRAKRSPGASSSQGQASPVARVLASLSGFIVPALVIAAVLSAGLIGWRLAGRQPAPEPPVTRIPIVSLNDTPAEAITKSHARYLLNWADSLDEFADRADGFSESGEAAQWFMERTTRARKEAYSDPGGFDPYVFGHAGGTPDGQDRYDAPSLKKGARQMAAESRADAAKLLTP